MGKKTAMQILNIMIILKTGEVCFILTGSPVVLTAFLLGLATPAKTLLSCGQYINYKNNEIIFLHFQKYFF